MFAVPAEKFFARRHGNHHSTTTGAPAAGVQQFGRTAVDDGDFQKAAGTDQRGQFPGCTTAVRTRLFRESACRSRKFASCRCDPAAASIDERNIRDQIAETIDPAHRAFNAMIARFRLRPIEHYQFGNNRPQSLRLQSQTQLAGNRREDVAPMKCVRYRGQPVLAVRQFDNSRRPRSLGQQAEQPIIRGEILLIADAGIQSTAARCRRQDRPPPRESCRPETKWSSRPDSTAPCAHILRANFMRNDRSTAPPD